MSDTKYWDDEAGNVVEGKIIDLDRGQTSFATDVPIVKIDTGDGGSVDVWGSRSVLRRELEAKRPKVGETIRIEYGGMRTAKSGTEYHFYTVSMPDRSGEGFWTAPVEGHSVAGRMEEQYGRPVQKTPTMPPDEAPF